MDYRFKTPLDGVIMLTTDLAHDSRLLADRNLYKFIWVRSGTVVLEVDHMQVRINENEIITLTPFHHVRFIEAQEDYLSLLFNSNFYCIYGHDDEVSCNGFLFHGSSELRLLKLSDEQAAVLRSISDIMLEECRINDDLQEEMLRILLKRFIISCTRIAREKFSVTSKNLKSFDIIRRFYVLVDNHYKEKKQVQEYADMLFRSPKTLSNLFAEYGFPPPLQVIHERVAAEARRLLLYTEMSAKEIGDLLGFVDNAAFSRFFRKMGGESISDFRKKNMSKRSEAQLPEIS